MILTDGVHLISDQSIDELHTFAQGMGLKRHWFQNKRGPRPRPHYDLTTENALDRALEQGVVGLSPMDIVRILIETYDKNYDSDVANLSRVRGKFVGLPEVNP